MHLDRASLEKLQLLCRRFRDVIDAELQHACLRPLLTASLELRAYKTYVLEVEQVYRPPSTAGKSCVCGASETTPENANHFLSDWLIRERGLTQLQYWEPCRVTYKYCHTPDDMEGKQRWCTEGRPLWGEDLEKFFRENFEWTYRSPRSDALARCSWVERERTGEPRQWDHWYYGNQTHCEAGIDVGLVRGEDFRCFHAHYFDKDPSKPVLFTARDHLITQVVDSYDKAARLLLAVLRCSVVLNEVRMTQFFLSPVFDDLLQKYGDKVYIAGALMLDICDARQMSTDLIKGFAEVGAVHLQNATLRSEQVDDAFVRHCVEANVTSVVLPECSQANEDTILKFCFGCSPVNPFDRRFITPEHSGRMPGWRVLSLGRGNITGNFLKNLVQAFRDCPYDINVCLIIQAVDGFQEQVDWAFVDNPLEAVDVEFVEETHEYEHYRFEFHKPDTTKMLLHWVPETTSIFLQMVKAGGKFEEAYWDKF